MRISVTLAHAYRLLNHGPLTLISSAHADQRNIMAAAWAMPVDFQPPKVAVVIDRTTFTRELIEASGEFVLAVPTRAIADKVVAAGSQSGRDCPEGDKFDALALATLPASKVAAPLPTGCIGWLECRLIPEPHIQQAHDLFVAEAVAAWADERAFAHGKFRPLDDTPPEWRTLHHLGAGNFVVPGAQIQGERLQ